MNHVPLELDVVAAFRRQLAELPEPLQRSRRAPAITAAAALAAAPLVAVLAGTDGSSEALAITRTATTLELRIAGPRGIWRASSTRPGSAGACS